MSKNIFSTQLKNFRKAADMTQAELAERLNIHIQTVSKWERGVSEPDVCLICEISKLFGVTVGMLVCGEEGGRDGAFFNAETLGLKIRRLRAARGEEQKSLAAALSVSPDTVSKWEHGKICPDLDNLIALSEYFGVTVTELYFGSGESSAPPAPAVKRVKPVKRIIFTLIAVIAVLVAVALSLAFTIGNAPASQSGATGENTHTSQGSGIEQPPDSGEEQPPESGEEQPPASGEEQPPASVKCEHDFGEEQIVPPGCEKDGVKVRVCKACGEEERVPIPALGHKIEKLEAVSAGCSTSGLTEGSRCSVCRKVFVMQKPVQPLGHSYENGSCTRCESVITPADASLFNFELKADGTYELSSVADAENLPAELVIPWEYCGKAVTSVRERAFEGCENIISVTVPDCIKRIGIKAIYCSDKLQAVYYTGNLEGWLNLDIGGDNFRFPHKLYFGGRLLTDLVIPEGCAVINPDRFAYCSSIKTISLPDSVTEIKWYAFEHCTSLESVVIPYSVLKIGIYAFSSCSAATIYCEATEQPEGWVNDWNFCTPDVVWGYVKN